MAGGLQGAEYWQTILAPAKLKNEASVAAADWLISSFPDRRHKQNMPFQARVL